MTTMVDCLINGRWNLKLPSHRAERPEWHTEEGWERKRLDAMHDCIGPGDVIYYVGAELGEMPALCKTWGAEVYLFEPNPAAWPSCSSIWKANDLKPPAFCFNGFASETTDYHLKGGHLWCNTFPACSEDEIIEAHGFKELYLEAENYPQITLDYVADMGEAPTVISFDVEGSEWNVLRGATKILNEDHPTLFASIHPEFMFHQWGEYAADFRSWIKSFGYREQILDYQHELHCMYEPI